MRLTARTILALAATLGAAAASWPQTSGPPLPRPSWAPAPTPPPTVPGYVVTVEIQATAPDIKAPDKAGPEAQALIGRLKGQASLKSRIHLAQDLSRQEILSTDFILPQGTLILHKAGDRYYAIADPKAKTFLVMDAEALLTALEGGVGIVNSQYDVRVEHTGEKKPIAGIATRKSIILVKYVGSIPLENDRVMVQQKNDVEVWHTSTLASSAAMDHFFFKYQRDKTGAVRKALAAEVGFPMEVNFVVSQGEGKKGQLPQPGSFHMVVTEAKLEKELDSELFRIPPAGYKRIEKNPYFAPGAQATGTIR